MPRFRVALAVALALLVSSSLLTEASGSDEFVSAKRLDGATPCAGNAASCSGLPTLKMITKTLIDSAVDGRARLHSIEAGNHDMESAPSFSYVPPLLSGHFSPLIHFCTLCFPSNSIILTFIYIFASHSLAELCFQRDARPRPLPGRVTRTDPQHGSLAASSRSPSSLPTSSTSSASHTSHASLSRSSEAQMAVSVQVPINAPFTNASFKTGVCDTLSSHTFESIIVYMNATQAGVPPSTRLQLPWCLGTYSNILGLVLTGPLILDDWASIPTSLTSMIINSGNIGPRAYESAIGFNSDSTIAWDAIFTRLPALISFSIDTTAVSGSLPSTLPSSLLDFALTNLPGITGTIPSPLLSAWTPGGPSSSVARLVISNTSISGSLPNALFSSQSALNDFAQLTIDLHSNHLSGLIPSSWLDVFNSALFYRFALDLHGNLLDGSIPSAFFPPGLMANGASTTTIFSADLSDNALEGALPPLLLPTAYSVSFSAARNLLSGALPLPLFSGTFNSTLLNTASVNLSGNMLAGTIPPTIIMDAFQVNTSLNTLLLDLSSNMIDGNIPDGLFYKVISGATVPTTLQVSSRFTLNLRSNSFTGTLPSSLGIMPTRQLAYSSLDVGQNRLSGPLPDSYGGRSWRSLSIDENPGFNGTIPRTFTDSVSMNFNARNTSLYGDLPGPQLSLSFVDLSHTLINFCSAPSNTSLSSVPNGSCYLLDTQACDCPGLFSNCEVRNCRIPPSPVSLSPLLVPTSSNCPLPAPSPQFICDNGRWVITTTTTTTITIPADLGTVIIKGNVTSSTIIIGGTGSTVLLEGCAGNLTGIVVELTKQDLEKLDPKTIYPLLTLGNGSSRCNDLSSVVVSTRVKDGGCRKVKSVTPSTWTSNSLGALFVVDSSGCNRWWIILVSVIAVVVLIGVAAGVVGIVLWNRNKLLKADTMMDEISKKRSG